MIFHATRSGFLRRRHRVRRAYRARVLTEVARQTARAVLDGEGGAILHVCAGLGRIIFVVQH